MQAADADTKPPIATTPEDILIQLQLFIKQRKYEWIIDYSDKWQIDSDEVRFWRLMSLCMLNKSEEAARELQSPTTDQLKSLYAVIPQFSGDYTTSYERLCQMPQSDQSDMQKISCLVAMNEYSWATAMISELCKSPSVAVQQFCARQLLVMGNLSQARQLIQDIQTDNHDQLMLNRSMIALCQGDFASAQTILATLMSASPQNKVAINNLCVCMLHHGNKLQEAISLLSQFVGDGLSDCSKFNLTTMLELATETIRTKSL